MSETTETTLPKSTHEVKAMLNALSKEVFGASSRWQKLVNKGFTQVVTEESKEMTPTEADPSVLEEKIVTVPVRAKSGGIVSTTKRHTVESVYKLMLDLKARRDAYLARVKAHREAQEKLKAEEALRKSVQEQISGSANGNI